MLILATSGGWAYLSLNPVGIWSTTALFLSAAAWFLVERRLFRSERGHGWVMVIAPLILLVMMACSKIGLDSSWLGLNYAWPMRRNFHPDAPYQFAQYILIAVAVVLSAKASRMPIRDLRVVGIIEFLLALTFLTWESWAVYDWNRSL